MLKATRGSVLRAVLCVCLLVPPVTLVAQQTDRPAKAELTPAQRDSLVAVARAQLGRRYVLGGERPDEGFDCSGLIRHILSAFDLRLPRTAALQAMIGREVPKDRQSLRPGDILTFGRGNRISHVGIYIGEGRFVHASTSSRRVVESSLDHKTSSLVRQWLGVRRVFASADSVPKPTVTPTMLSPIIVNPRGM